MTICKHCCKPIEEYQNAFAIGGWIHSKTPKYIHCNAPSERVSTFDTQSWPIPGVTTKAEPMPALLQIIWEGENHDADM